jgi:hypothetical protein
LEALDNVEVSFDLQKSTMNTQHKTFASQLRAAWMAAGAEAAAGARTSALRGSQTRAVWRNWRATCMSSSEETIFMMAGGRVERVGGDVCDHDERKHERNAISWQDWKRQR